MKEIGIDGCAIMNVLMQYELTKIEVSYYFFLE